MRMPVCSRHSKFKGKPATKEMLGRLGRKEIALPKVMVILVLLGHLNRPYLGLFLEQI